MTRWSSQRVQYERDSARAREYVAQREQERYTNFSKWQNRDSFDTMAEARQYAAHKQSQHPTSEYRIVVRKNPDRFVVQFRDRS